jgi:transposase-like protein/rRNA-processing protein FCF1
MGIQDAKPDILVANRTFPDALALVAEHIPVLDSVHDQCDVVLDTNVLLLPYTTGSDSLKEIAAVYQRLHKAKRLFVPAQVSREFAKNRATKLTEMYKTLVDKRSKIVKPETTSYPLIADLEQYRILLTREESLSKEVIAYRKAVDNVLDEIRKWGWNDPVAEVYRTVFDKNVIIECKRSNEDILANLQDRMDNKIPPGYKDAGKDDNGIGDVLIWLTILEIGEQRKKPLLFVSLDEKADWQHRVDNRGFLPRFELVDEYRRASSGQPFYIAPFSTLLQLFGAPTAVVTEVRGREGVTHEDVECPYCSANVSCMLSEQSGSTSHPNCEECGRVFTLHRNADGFVIVRKQPKYEKTIDRDRQSLPYESRSKANEALKCPFCETFTVFQLGEAVGSSATPLCEACGKWFHAHRSSREMITVHKPGGN